MNKKVDHQGRVRSNKMKQTDKYNKRMTTLLVISIGILAICSFLFGGRV